jgi:hypothetical protein
MAASNVARKAVVIFPALPCGMRAAVEAAPRKS